VYDIKGWDPQYVQFLKLYDSVYVKSEEDIDLNQTIKIYQTVWLNVWNNKSDSRDDLLISNISDKDGKIKYNLNTLARAKVSNVSIELYFCNQYFTKLRIDFIRTYLNLQSCRLIKFNSLEFSKNPAITKNKSIEISFYNNKKMKMVSIFNNTINDSNKYCCYHDKYSRLCYGSYLSLDINNRIIDIIKAWKRIENTDYFNTIYRYFYKISDYLNDKILNKKVIQFGCFKDNNYNGGGTIL